MKVFFAALDWGLGHTTRSVPVLRNILNHNHQLFIGCTQRQEIIYRQNLSVVRYIRLGSTEPVLSNSGSQTLAFLRYIPQFLRAIRKERRSLHKLHQIHNFNLVLSDNRYGIYIKGCKNILISHQLNLILPDRLKTTSWLVNRIIHRWINRFDTCIVPDYKSSLNLTSKLSQIFKGCKPEIIHTGPLSMMSSIIPQKTEIPEVLIILSGPEKQRSVFEQKIINQLDQNDFNCRTLVIRGLPGSSRDENDSFRNHAPSAQLKYLIQHVPYIICRSGYSTIMDLVTLNKTAYLVPTPGQSEQEYLARHLKTSGWFLSGQQKDFNLQLAVEQLRIFNRSPFPLEWSENPSETFPFEKLF